MKRLTALSERILKSKLVELEEVGEGGVEDNFLKQLVVDMQRGEVSQANVVQCILEMLIAGTDTSSVSLFYTLVCLADSSRWDQAVAREVVGLEEQSPPSSPSRWSPLASSPRNPSHLEGSSQTTHRSRRTLACVQPARSLECSAFENKRNCGT